VRGERVYMMVGKICKQMGFQVLLVRGTLEMRDLKMRNQAKYGYKTKTKVTCGIGEM